MLNTPLLVSPFGLDIPTASLLDWQTKQTREEGYALRILYSSTQGDCSLESGSLFCSVLCPAVLFPPFSVRPSEWLLLARTPHPMPSLSQPLRLPFRSTAARRRLPSYTFRIVNPVNHSGQGRQIESTAYVPVYTKNCRHGRGACTEGDFVTFPPYFTHASWSSQSEIGVYRSSRSFGLYQRWEAKKR